MKKKIIQAFCTFILAIFGVYLSNAYTDIPAGPGKIWVGPFQVEGQYVDHEFIPGGIRVRCSPETYCCDEIVNGGSRLRLWDEIISPPGPFDSYTPFHEVDDWPNFNSNLNKSLKHKNSDLSQSQQLHLE